MRISDAFLALFEVACLAMLAVVGLVILPFYCLWGWWVGDAWWEKPKGRPAKGFWNTDSYQRGRGGHYDHPDPWDNDAS